jgi:hypothetical protein
MDKFQGFHELLVTSFHMTNRNIVSMSNPIPVFIPGLSVVSVESLPLVGSIVDSGIACGPTSEKINHTYASGNVPGPGAPNLSACAVDPLYVRVSKWGCFRTVALVETPI